MRLYLIRHGESEGNVQGVIQGQTESDLTSMGQDQAAALAQRLRTEHFDAIYCSDLTRARATLAFITAGRTVPVIFLPELREKAFGLFEGRKFDLYLKVFEASGRGLAEFCVPGGESFLDLKQRTDRLLETLLRKHGDETVLLCTHGGTIRSFLTTLLGLSFEQAVPYSVDNTSLWAFEINALGRASVVVLNDTRHLSELAALTPR